ncbi:MAG TPA: mycothione reductase [Acidimicrobiales bacterium]|nr:mycothione reductase [Acidimicrobiales bacterium]
MEPGHLSDHDFDLVIVGTGSGNAIPPELDGMRIALVERGVFGGTCLNVGCIPSKMFIYAADVAMHVRESERYGVRATLDGVDWPGIVERIFGRIDPIVAGGERYRIEDCSNITVFQGHGEFVDHKVLQVGGERIRGERFILAAGARPYIPDVPGLADVGFHTSDTVMRLPALPERMAVLGGGYIATELGHVFEAFGTRVSILNRGPHLLRSEDGDISHRYTDIVAGRFDLHLETAVRLVERTADGTVRLHLVHQGEESVLEVDEVLVATGRIPNSDELAVEKTGVRTDPSGRVVVHEDLQTDVAGIWALGDITNRYQLKHVANAEAKVVFHNVAHPDDPWLMDYSIVPHAVFGNPQVASVGMTERQAANDGVPFVTAIKEYGTTAYGWAMEDTTSFVKLVAHAQTRRLLGAHILGPQASTLIQLLVQGMRFGQTVDEMAREQMWVHPALTEVLENALLDL